MPIARLLGWLGGSKSPGISDALWDDTLASLPFCARLNAEERQRLRALCDALLAEKEFTAAGDLELTDVMCASIAVQGCLPILNLGLSCYRDWVGIIVYPDEFIVPRKIEDEFGVVHEYDDIASGEAWDGGPLLISWHDAQMAGEGYNVAIHEFAHKLDMLNGEADGIPPLPPGVSHPQWEETLFSAYDDFCAKVDAAEQYLDDSSDGDIAPLDTLDTLFDPYAAESPAEFFAVMSETFFEAPDLLRAEYPAFYALLCRFYRQDPAARDDALGLSRSD